MKTEKRILIIIVTWNKKNYVIDLLTSLDNLDYPRTQLDILVVDNASDDGTVEALNSQFPEVKLLVNSENLGGTGGFNTGLAWAFEQPENQYDYLWLLDNDVVVHKKALSELVAVLQSKPDVAVVGSTMMQLDYPWRINEMGAFVDRGRGRLIFNRHLEEIWAWQGVEIDALIQMDLDLSKSLHHCQATMDVDYVAAASLLIRAKVAREAGLWLDFFIHFDDVEWCLRIQEQGHRILVSAKSLIWHLSAIAKIPTWILYYDNRNVLYLLDKHSDTNAVKGTVRWNGKKALYYALVGKLPFAELILEATDDFYRGVVGKKQIKLSTNYHPITQISNVLLNPEIKTILLPWTINTQASELQEKLVEVMKQRPDLRLFYLVPPRNLVDQSERQVPESIPVFVSDNKILRYVHYLRFCNRFDLVMQSEYQPILPLSWISRKILFCNYETFCLYSRTNLKQLLDTLLSIYKLYVKTFKAKKLNRL